MRSFFRGFLLFLQRVQGGVAVILGTLGGGSAALLASSAAFWRCTGILRSFQGSWWCFLDGGLFFSVVRIAALRLFQSGSSFVPLGLGTETLFTIGVDSACFLCSTF